jgi:hypothetical protein
MRLAQHDDFADVVIAATAWLRGRGMARIGQHIVEKDYYVTEVLRAVAARPGYPVVFKGGTSLSKGWGLIDRFSEDVDLLLVAPGSSRRQSSDALRAIAELAAADPALEWQGDDKEHNTDRSRCDVFRYATALGGVAAVRPEVVLEAGARGVGRPTEQRWITSFVGQFLREHGAADSADDIAPFSMDLLHFRRTFAEKVFTIHCKVEGMRKSGDALGRNARHYYDLAVLAVCPEIERMLRSDEYATFGSEYREIAARHFRFQTEHLPADMRFGQSRALFPDRALADILRPAYQQECRNLCFTDGYPSFDDVLARLERLRSWL